MATATASPVKGLLLLMGKRPIANKALTAKEAPQIEFYYPESPVIDSLDGLAEYLYKEFFRISAMLEIIGRGQLDRSYAAPSNPRNGMVRFADGTQWDPGSGEGFYGYYNNTWNKLG